jgi:predicted nucleic acid-binding protein
MRRKPILTISCPSIDLQIALTALEHGAGEIWTHDRHFLAVPGLPINDPLGPRTR